MNRWTWIMMCTVIAGFLLYIRIGLSTTIRENQVRELHNVEVLQKNADRVYTVDIPNQGIMTIRLCSYGDDLPLSKGMVINPFQYIQKNDCLLIDGRTFDDWKRDKDRNVVDKNGKILFAKE